MKTKTSASAGNTANRLSGRIALSFLVSMCFLIGIGGFAPSSPVHAQSTGLPPIIDRELLFGDPEIAGAQLSPDGKFIAFIKPYKGTRNVWIKRTGEPFDAAKPVTADTTRPISQYFWSRDGKFILYAQDKGGDENFNLYAVNPAEPLTDGRDVPTARNLTPDVKNVRVFIQHLPKNDPDALFIGLNDRDPAWHDLYKVKISTGERTLVRKNTEHLAGVAFDLKDQLRLGIRSADNGDTEILRIDGDKTTKVYSCTVFESATPLQFHKDGKRVYLSSNKGDTNFIRLTLLDVETGAEEVIDSDPMKRADLENAVFSQVTDELVLTVYEDEKVRFSWKNKASEADYKFVQKKFAGREIAFGSSTADENLWLLTVFSDTEPGETHLFDRKTKKLTFQYRIREKLPRASLSPMLTVRYPSSDGLEIPAYLTLPKGAPAKNLPAVIFPHGGPWARDSWGYNSRAQFLANRGYAVLQPNFRGSTGFGKKFIDAANKEWGQKMQDDLTWGVKYLVAQGIADPNRVAIMGGSYGGYATLAGLTFTPDLYAAGVSIVGPSNLNTLLETIPPYWEPIRKLFHERMGDPTTPEGKAQLDRQSPLNSADKIKKPLLVIQGANDPRVKKAESDQIVVALRERNFPVEYIVAPDEGHGFARPVNNMVLFAASEKFLAKHIGGRFQESMTPEVAQRLTDITVDVKTVTLARKIDPASVGVPQLSGMLKAGTSTYKASIEFGGQKIPLDITSEIKDEGGNWLVSETAKTPMGDMSDVTVLDKTNLTVLKRTVKQGPVTIDVAFKDNKATGTMAMNGQSRPVSADLGGRLFADGAGSMSVLAALPLAEGYATTFRNFDLQTAKVKLVQLKVVGTENVTVPAGTFEAFKVETSSPDGERATMWIPKNDRKPVKTVAVLPQMNGAVMTIELAR